MSTRARRLSAALIGVGRWGLVALVLCLALIGFLHLTRGTAVQHVRGVAADGVPIGVGEPEFPLAVTMLTGASTAPGNRVELMLNGDGTYDRLWSDLRANLMVLDQALGDEMNRMFLDDLRHAKEITAPTFGARSWLQRIAERGAN